MNTKPQADQIKAETHVAIVAYQNKIINQGIWRTCLNCDYFISVRAVVNSNISEHKKCSLFHVVPPPEIIVNGCEKWEQDIPF